DAIGRGAKARQGAGEALAKYLGARKDLPGRDASVLLACAELDVPVTVHAAIGAEIIHQHPSADGPARGATSQRDFKLLAPPGHHEILFPLLAWAVLARLEP